MNLTSPEPHTVWHVVQNMRVADREVCFAQRWNDDPLVIHNDLMAQRQFAWVAWADNFPAAVFGCSPMHPGVWQTFIVATDAFPKVCLPLTRFAKRQVVPRVFGELGGHRIQADLHEKHAEAHRWVELMGGHREGTKRRFGRDGSDYFVFALLKDVDSHKSTV